MEGQAWTPRDTDSDRARHPTQGHPWASPLTPPWARTPDPDSGVTLGLGQGRIQLDCVALVPTCPRVPRRWPAWRR